MAVIDRKCVYCSEIFKVNSSNRKKIYCSNSCRVAHHYQKKEAQRLIHELEKLKFE
jgi:hypothetical protein